MFTQGTLCKLNKKRYYITSVDADHQLARVKRCFTVCELEKSHFQTGLRGSIVTGRDLIIPDKQTEPQVVTWNDLTPFDCKQRKPTLFVDMTHGLLHASDEDDEEEEEEEQKDEKKQEKEQEETRTPTIPHHESCSYTDSCDPKLKRLINSRFAQAIQALGGRGHVLVLDGSRLQTTRRLFQVCPECSVIVPNFCAACADEMRHHANQPATKFQIYNGWLGEYLAASDDPHFIGAFFDYMGHFHGNANQNPRRDLELLFQQWDWRYGRVILGVTFCTRSGCGGSSGQNVRNETNAFILKLAGTKHVTLLDLQLYGAGMYFYLYVIGPEGRVPIVLA